MVRFLKPPQEKTFVFLLQTEFRGAAEDIEAATVSTVDMGVRDAMDAAAKALVQLATELDAEVDQAEYDATEFTLARPLELCGALTRPAG